MSLTIRMDCTTLSTTTRSVTLHVSNAGYTRSLCPSCLCGNKGSNLGIIRCQCVPPILSPIVTPGDTSTHTSSKKIPCFSPIRVEKQGQIINRRSQTSHSYFLTPISYFLPLISPASKPRMRLKLLHERLEQIALGDDADHTLVFVNHW